MKEKKAGQLPELPKNIGAQIRLLRTQQGMTQAQLAGFAEISTQYLSEVELGKRNVSIDLLAKIANELHVSLNELINISPSQSKKDLIGKINTRLEELTHDQLILIYRSLTSWTK